MKTSYTEIIRTEKFLRQEMGADDSLVFQARILLSSELRANTYFHKLVQRLVRLYHRRQVKAEIETLHSRLFNDPSKTAFREGIVRLFNR
jgi:hypothetical protein